MSDETLVLGLGNPLRGDDGIGPAVLEWLRQRGLPPDVVAVDGGTAGLELVNVLQRRQRVLIIDAAHIGRAPGEWICLALDPARLAADEATLSLHTAGLAEALALCEALGVLPEEIILFGVQPAGLDWSISLSAEARAVVPVVGQAVLQALRERSSSFLSSRLRGQESA